MALGNFIMSGTYSVITDLYYDKQTSQVNFNLRVYTNSSKAVMVSCINYPLNGRVSFSTIKSSTTQTPPESPQSGDSYLVPSGATGDWLNLVDKIVHWSPAVGETPGSWNESSDNQTRYVEDSQTYISKAGSTWVSVSTIDSHTFEDWFGIGAIGGTGTDILSASYTWLKSRPEFASCTDV